MGRESDGSRRAPIARRGAIIAAWAAVLAGCGASVEEQPRRASAWFAGVWEGELVAALPSGTLIITPEYYARWRTPPTGASAVASVRPTIESGAGAEPLAGQTAPATPARPVTVWHRMTLVGTFAPPARGAWRPADLWATTELRTHIEQRGAPAAVLVVRTVTAGDEEWEYGILGRWGPDGPGEVGARPAWLDEVPLFGGESVDLAVFGEHTADALAGRGRVFRVPTDEQLAQLARAPWPR